MKKTPFDFVLEALDSKAPYTKPMFGAVGVYVDGKIVLILRDKPDYPDDNGVWIATTEEHHVSLKKDFPNMRSIGIFGPGPTGWQVLSVTSEDFEESALRLCELILSGDPRIGKVPKSRRYKVPSSFSKKSIRQGKSPARKRKRKTS